MEQRKSFRQASETPDTFRFIKDFLVGGLKEINPWPNIKILHTNIGQDILAGIVVAVVALPLALAFGVASGLGAITGLWGAIVGGIVGGLLGGSKIGVSGPTGPKVVQLAGVMIGFRLASGEPDLGAAFAMVAFSGVILIALSLLRVSRFIYYTPYSVVAGFMCGIGVIVMLLEFDHFMGVPAQHSIMDAIMDIPFALTHVKWQALTVSVTTLGLILIWPRVIKLLPKIGVIPGPLVGLIVGTGIAYFGEFDIEYIGEIPSGLPSIYWPDWSRFGELFVPAASLAGLAVFDSLLTCVVIDHMTGDRHSSDRETFGQGVANIVCGLVGGVSTATATMRSITNLNAGGKTPLAAIVHGLVLMALVLGLGPLAAKIPMACLAGILIKVGIDILDWRIIPVLHRLPLTDMLVFWVVFVVTIVEDLLVAMGVGVVLAFFRFVQEVSKVYKHEVSYVQTVESVQLEAESDNHIKVLHPSGPLFFGAIEPLEKAYSKAKDHDVLIIDLKEVHMIDLSGAYALQDLIEKVRLRGKKVLVCGASPNVSYVLERVKILHSIGEDSWFEEIEDAVIKAKSLGIAPAN